MCVFQQLDRERKTSRIKPVAPANFISKMLKKFPQYKPSDARQDFDASECVGQMFAKLIVEANDEDIVGSMTVGFRKKCY